MDTRRYSLDFLLDIALREHHDPAEQLAEGDASLGASARLVQPLGYLVRHSITQHFVDEGLQAQGRPVRTGTSLERFTYTSQLTIRHCK